MILDTLSKYVFYPLWDLKDKSNKLKELAKLEKTQWLPLDELHNHQWTKLLSIVSYASANSPYYKKIFNDRDIQVNKIQTLSDFQKIPVTTKLNIRNNTSMFISSEYKKEQLETAKTGGSTGVSLELYFDSICQDNRNAAAIRSDHWAGWEIGQKRAALWGNPPVPRTLKEKIRHYALDRMIFLDTMLLDDESMMEFVNLWRHQSPKAVFGHAHSIYVFAKFLEKNRIVDLQPDAIVATSMMLLSHERTLIESVFKCSVTNRYGCEEVGLIACECEKHDGMHLNIDHLYIEFLDDEGQPVQPGEQGKITVTDFNNHGMPLIRYQVGDVGVATDRICSCGRGLPLMEKLEGRVADFLVTATGGMVSGISLVERTLTKIPGIEQMQLVQESESLLTINRVKGQEYQKETDQQLKSELTDVFGTDVIYQIKDVKHIPQEKSGKYRFSICKVNV